MVLVLAWGIGSMCKDLGTAKFLVSVLDGKVSEGIIPMAVFGDHCSPISDTTIMSSMASASDHIDHVKTQIPYSLTCAVIALLVSYLPAAIFGMNPFLSLIIGWGLAFTVVKLYGKEVEAPEMMREEA